MMPHCCCRSHRSCRFAPSIAAVEARYSAERLSLGRVVGPGALGKCIFKKKRKEKRFAEMILTDPNCHHDCKIKRLKKEKKINCPKNECTHS